jgi:hypothetical protein
MVLDDVRTYDTHELWSYRCLDCGSVSNTFEEPQRPQEPEL